MASLSIQALSQQSIIALLGLCVGSFLNVVSLRTLAGKSIIWPPSHCPNCEHRLPAWDNIPLLSYLLLQGRCRYCQVKISWQYPVVEVLTAIMFLVFFKCFGLTWNCLGMLVFGSTLIAVCITDFREKLIPHDITYPAMLLGILFSTMVRKDFVGAMIGIGASYILFDFLAHYGLKAYLHFYGYQGEHIEETGDADDEVDQAFALSQDSGETLEEFEVMGGGDAVLSAVISAWLGWQRLLVAVAVGFLVGTIMGMVLLIKEMQKADILKECLRPAIVGAVLGFAALGLPCVLLAVTTGVNILQGSGMAFATCGALAGLMAGVVSVGTRVSKPFPFGPALAVGAMVAIFWDPIGALLAGGA